MKQVYPLSEVYRLLEPGPVVLVTTSVCNRPNIMTMSWHSMLEFEPSLIACVISNRNHSFEAITQTRECAINIPTASLAQQVVGIGNCSGRNTDKFAKFALTQVAASCIAAPLIEECYANLECRLVDDSMVEKYGLFVLEAVKAWADPLQKNPQTLHHRGCGDFMIAGRTISLPSAMK